MYLSCSAICWRDLAIVPSCYAPLAEYIYLKVKDIKNYKNKTFLQDTYAIIHGAICAPDSRMSLSTTMSEYRLVNFTGPRKKQARGRRNFYEKIPCWAKWNMKTKLVRFADKESCSDYRMDSWCLYFGRGLKSNCPCIFLFLFIFFLPQTTR